MSLVFHITPVYVTYYLLRYGIPSVEGLLSAFRSLSLIPVSVSLSYTLAYVVRGIGRYRNTDYHQFLQSLSNARNLNTVLGPAEAERVGISGYDFEMFAYPVTFRHDESIIKPRRLASAKRRGLLEKIISLPLSTLRYIAAHVVARRLIYPGSNALFNMLLETEMSKSRCRLRREHDAYRAKLATSDKNFIDCIFIDKRGSPDATANGNKLIICCEGNAAYYELGVLQIPLQMGYSVVGWNHPGFGESTGLPFPSQEANAIDVVIKYAVTRLGFGLENITLLAWSIGGYTASCAAMYYPEIGGVILDATFDDITPLVLAAAPKLLESFSRGMVEEQFKLNIAEQMCHYPGPISIVRREKDEMMSHRSNLSTNRANFLLIKILQNRYPNLVTPESLKELWKWLSVSGGDWGRKAVLDSLRVDSSLCRAQMTAYTHNNGCGYPMMIGDHMTSLEKSKMLLFMATQYMVNYDSTHCTPLPHHLMSLPRDKGNLR